MPESLPGEQYTSGNAALTNQGTGQQSDSLTTNTPDPWRNFLLNTILQQTGTKGEIPGYTLSALENFTKNPSSAAADFFPQLAAPLLEANKASQARESTRLADEFRKAGGTGNGAMQSGAYAQAQRQLSGDFARQDQEILAKNYVPLTGQISENINNAIRGGLAVPSATSELIKPLASLTSNLAPLQTRTQTTGVNQNIGAPGGAITQDAQRQLVDQQIANYASLGPTAGGSPTGSYYR